MKELGVTHPAGFVISFFLLNALSGVGDPQNSMVQTRESWTLTNADDVGLGRCACIYIYQEPQMARILSDQNSYRNPYPPPASIQRFGCLPPPTAAAAPCAPGASDQAQRERGARAKCDPDRRGGQSHRAWGGQTRRAWAVQSRWGGHSDGGGAPTLEAAVEPLPGREQPREGGQCELEPTLD